MTCPYKDSDGVFVPHYRLINDTGLFAGMADAIMFNALACRSESKSVLRGEIGLFRNSLFNWAVSLSLAGQLLVIYFPWLQEVFQTEALGFMDLLWLVMLCSTVFWVDELRKWLKYGRRRLGGNYSQAV